jgi:hypothetical protein
MKSLFSILILALATSAHAATTSANHGHHGGGNNGAVGSAVGTSQAAASGSTGAAQSGNGSRYAFEDNYQPWPQAEMAQFQKPHWTPYAGK